MKVLLVLPRNPIAGKQSDFAYQFSLGLPYISASLKAANHEVSCLNLNHIDGDVGEILKEKIASADPETIMTGGLSTSFLAVKNIVSVCRRISSAKIVVGGGVLSATPQLTAENIDFDCGLLGEADESAVEILENMNNPGSVLGACYRSGKEVIFSSERKPISNLDKIPTPDFEGFGFEEYLSRVRCNSQWFLSVHDQPRFYPIITSRSCPYGCTFCFHPLGRGYRRRSLGAIEDELLDGIKRWKANIVAVYDELFEDEFPGGSFCDMMVRLSDAVGRKILWFSQMRVDKVCRADLKKMRASGCFGLSLGLESANATVLASMQKKISRFQIRDAIAKVRDAKIGAVGNFIFGDRAETIETALDTLWFWRDYCASGAITIASVIPYPGTELYKNCLRLGKIESEIAFLKYEQFVPVNATNLSTFQYWKMRVLMAFFRTTHTMMVTSKHKTKLENGFAVSHQCPECNMTITTRNCSLTNRTPYRLFVICRHCGLRTIVVSPGYKIINAVLKTALNCLPIPITGIAMRLTSAAQLWLVKRLMLGKTSLGWVRKIISI